MTVKVWSNRPIRSSTAVGSPNIDFTGLYDFGALLLTIEGLQHADVGADADVLIQVSHDGVTFDSTAANYNHIALPGGAGFVLNTALAENVQLAERVLFTHWNEDKPTWVSSRGGRSNSSSGARSFDAYHAPARRCQALRITNSLGYNWTVNNGVYLRQRQWP